MCRKPLALALLALSLTVVASVPGRAQNTTTKPSAGQNTPAKKPPSAAPEKPNQVTPLFSMDLKDTPLWEALQTLFINSAAEYSIDPLVPDPKINVKMTDQPLDQALRIILRASGQKLTYEKTGDVYFVKVASERKEDAIAQILPITYRRADDLIAYLQPRFPQADLLAEQGGNALIVTADVDTLNRVREMARMLDVQPREFMVKAEVAMVTAKGSKGTGSTLLSTTVRATAGREATGEDKTLGTPAQTLKFGLRVTVSPLGDGSVEVQNHWEISVPLGEGDSSPNKQPTLVRLEKQMTNVSRLRPGETTAVGGSILMKKYGLSGEILFFLTITPIDPQGAPPNATNGGVKP